MLQPAILLFATLASGAAFTSRSEHSPLRPRDGSCQPQPVQNPDPNSHCGQKGRFFPVKPKIIKHGRAKSCTTDYVGCYQQCQQNQPACVSFSYYSNNGYCRLFGDTLENLGFKENGKGNMEVYDYQGCFQDPGCTVDCPTKPPPTCSNQGIQWAEYDNDQGNNADPTYSNFDPSIYSQLPPDYTATTGSIGGIDVTTTNTQISIYGSSQTFNSNYFVLNHQGYFYPTISGTYTITLSAVDDIAFLWLGNNAYSGYTRDNADLTVPFNSPQHKPGQGSVQVPLSVGDYLPFRIIFGQAQGGAVFQVSVTDPNGNTVVDSNSAPSDQVVQYSCDQTTAPPFPAWANGS